MPSSKLIDLGKTYPEGPAMGMSASKDGKQKKHYPGFSIDPAAFDDLPTDGSKFYAVICGRVSNFSNPSDGEPSMSIEVRDMAQISEADAKKLVGESSSEDETPSSKKMPGFRETMKGVMAGKESSAEKDDEDEEY